MATSDVTVHIEGMHCGACVSRVESALKSVGGVTACAVNLTTGLANVSVDEHGARAEGLGNPEALEKDILLAVQEAGYKGNILKGAAAQTLRDVAKRGEHYEHGVRRRLVIGMLAGIPVVLIDLFHTRLLHIHSDPGLLALSVAKLLLATVVMATAGWPFFVGAARALIHRSASMDTLVALGTGVAYVYSLAILILQWTGRISIAAHHDELHAAVAIVVLVTLGKYLEARAKKRAASAVAGLATQAAETATIIRLDGQTETIPAHLVSIGQRLQILAHQTIPVDGLVVEGAGSVDQSLLTGESTPVEIVVPKNDSPHARPSGVNVAGGARLLDGRLIIEATSTASTSTVARILDLVNTAQASKTAIQGLADRVAGIFVPIVLVLALANFAAWWFFTGDLERAMMTTIAVIVIACPCAMGLATPTAVTVAMGRAAKMGILFTQASALETARTIRTVLFDKTGTLTTGQPQVVEVVPLANPENPGAKSDLLRLAASALQFSDHPLAKAVVEEAREQSMSFIEPSRFRSAPGGGVRATFADGREIAAGSAAYLTSLALPLDAPTLDRLTTQGMTIIVLADTSAQKILGIIGLRDALRDDAAETIRLLRARHIHVGIVSGDTEPAVRGAIQTIEVDSIHAGVKPEGKAELVNAQKHATENPHKKIESAVAFIGDGINDGPALAAADLGIAMAGGTHIAKSADDVILLGNSLRAVPAVLELSRITLRIIRQNLFWAFAYNVAAIPLAMAGLLKPEIAAAAMMLSSLTVVGNALRLYRVKL